MFTIRNIIVIISICYIIGYMINNKHKDMEIKSDNVMITLDDKIIYVYLNHHGNLTCSPHLPNIIKYNCTFLI